MNQFQRLLNSFGVGKQTKNAISPNQPKKRVFSNLQRNEDVDLNQVTQAANLADAELQQQVAKNNISAPPTDQGVNIASSQLPDGIPVDQSERVANGQGYLKDAQNRQNSGLPPNVGGGDGSSVNNLSSSNVPPSELNIKRYMRTRRPQLAKELQEELKTTGGITITRKDRDGNILKDKKGNVMKAVIKNLTPSLVEKRLTEELSLMTASSFGRKATQKGQALDLYATGYGGDAFGKTLNPASVVVTGETVPTMPSKSFAYSPATRELTRKLVDGRTVSDRSALDALLGKGKVTILPGNQLQRLENKYQNLTKLRNQYKALGGKTSTDALNKIDYQLEQIENIYAAANVKRTDFTGAPYIDDTADLSLKVPATTAQYEADERTGELTRTVVGGIGPKIARRFAGVREDQAAYRAEQLQSLRKEMGIYKQQEQKAREGMIAAEKANNPKLRKQKELQRNQAIAEQQKIYYEPRGKDAIVVPGYDPKRGRPGPRMRAMVEQSKNIIKEQTKMNVVLSSGSSEYKRAHATVSPLSGVKIGTTKDGKQMTTDVGNFEMMINPSTVEMRKGRSIIDTKEKGGGGRNVADYVGGEMGENEEISRAFMEELLNAQTLSNTEKSVNKREPNLYYTKGRRPRLVGRESIDPATQASSLQRYNSPQGASQQLVRGGSTEYAGMRSYDMETGGPPKTAPDDRTQAGYVKDIYGIRKAADPEDNRGVKPSQLVGNVKGPQNQRVSKEAQRIMEAALELTEAKRRGRIEGKPAFFYLP